MARWFEEVRLSRHPIAEIGAAFYIREMLGNNCLVSPFDLKDVFGENFDVTLENLRRAGMLEVFTVGNQLSLKIVAPGDAKRERCRLIGLRHRHESKGETDEETYQ